MKLWMLGSGSSGNALVISSGDEHIVIDAGFGTRTLACRLRRAGIAPDAVTACLLTHEHGDHIKGASRVAGRWDWPLFATAGTAAAPQLAESRVTTIASGVPIPFARLTAVGIATPHDAAESVGFVITEHRTGVRAAIFYDIGHISDAIRAACVGIDILVLESNHDDEMLRNGPYPPWLRARIASDTGHLSNRCASALAAESASGHLNQIVLAHISQHCNRPEIALAAVGGGLRRRRYRGGLVVAPQDGVIGPFQPRFARAEAPMQLSLL